MVIWQLEPEILLSLELQQSRWKLQRQIWDLRLQRVRRKSVHAIATTNSQIRQGNMAAITGNTYYISGTLTGGIEIPTAICVFDRDELEQSVSKQLRRWRTLEIELELFWRQFCNLVLISFRLSVVVTITCLQFCRARHGRKSWICSWNFNAVCHSSRDINISDFGGHTAISGCRWLMQWLGTLSSISLRSKTQVCRWNFDDICHTFGDKYFRFGQLSAILLFPVVGRYRKK